MARPARPAIRALRLVILFLAGIALVARPRRVPKFQAVLDPIEDVPVRRAQPKQQPARQTRPAARTVVRRRRRREFIPRRVVGSFAVALCFFAGAAFSAGAGDRVGLMLDDSPANEALPATTTETAPEDPAAVTDEAPVEEELAPPTQGSTAAEAAPAPAPEAPAAETPVAEAEATPDPATEPEPTAPRLGTEPASAAAPAPAAAEPAAAPAPAKTTAREPMAAPAPRPVRPSLEQASGVVASHTYWLARPFVETPAALQLAPAFADRLRATARRRQARWSVVFGVLRARGAESAVPAPARELDALAASLSHVQLEAKAISAALGRPAGSDFGERAAALARYARAVGLDTLVEGLEQSRQRLGERLLADERVDLYAGGREDVVADRIDPRVLALVSYLAETYGQVTVSSLTSGHRLYARPGILSAHVFGQAVDVAALGGIPALGNQQPGGLVEHAVRSILRLPADLRPQQVISLLGLGGPSFPMADHADHIHVGF